MRTIRSRKGATYDGVFRAWALHDPLAGRFLWRVDELRLTYTREIFEAPGFRELDAQNRARLLLCYEMSEPSMFSAQSAKLEDPLVRE